MDQVMDIPIRKDTTSNATLYWPRAAFWSSACGTINWPRLKARKILSQIFGHFCRNARRIPETSRRRHNEENRTSCRQEAEKKNPHPAPLPSDGRGKASEPFLLFQQLFGKGRWFDIPKPARMNSLSRPASPKCFVAGSRMRDCRGGDKNTKQFPTLVLTIPLFHLRSGGISFQPARF